MIPFPETRQTIGLQIAALQSGLKPAVLITAGNDAPDVDGFTTTKTPAGIFIHQMKEKQVVDAEKTGFWGHLLGHVIEHSEHTRLVVFAFKNGMECQTSLVDEEHMEAQKAQFRHIWPGAEIITGGESLAQRILIHRHTIRMMEESDHGNV